MVHSFLIHSLLPGTCRVFYSITFCGDTKPVSLSFIISITLIRVLLFNEIIYLYMEIDTWNKQLHTNTCKHYFTCLLYSDTVASSTYGFDGLFLIFAIAYNDSRKNACIVWYIRVLSIYCCVLSVRTVFKSVISLSTIGMDDNDLEYFPFNYVYVYEASSVFTCIALHVYFKTTQ